MDTTSTEGNYIHTDRPGLPREIMIDKSLGIKDEETKRAFDEKVTRLIDKRLQELERIKQHPKSVEESFPKPTMETFISLFRNIIEEARKHLSEKSLDTLEEVWTRMIQVELR